MLTERCMLCIRLDNYAPKNRGDLPWDWWQMGAASLATGELDRFVTDMGNSGYGTFWARIWKENFYRVLDWRGKLPVDAVVPVPRLMDRMIPLRVSVLAYHCDVDPVVSLYLHKRLGYMHRPRVL